MTRLEGRGIWRGHVPPCRRQRRQGRRAPPGVECSLEFQPPHGSHLNHCLACFQILPAGFPRASPSSLIQVPALATGTDRRGDAITTPSPSTAMKWPGFRGAPRLTDGTRRSGTAPANRRLLPRLSAAALALLLLSGIAGLVVSSLVVDGTVAAEGTCFGQGVVLFAVRLPPRGSERVLTRSRRPWGRSTSPSTSWPPTRTFPSAGGRRASTPCTPGPSYWPGSTSSSGASPWSRSRSRSRGPVRRRRPVRDPSTPSSSPRPGACEFTLPPPTPHRSCP